jgi:hypothetical protein
MSPVLRGSRLAIVVCALAATVIPAAQQAPSAPPANARPANPALDRYKQNVGQEVDGLQEMIQRMNDQVFSFGELGFQEFETTKYLTGILSRTDSRSGTSRRFQRRGWRAGDRASGHRARSISTTSADTRSPGVAYHDPHQPEVRRAGGGRHSRILRSSCRRARRRRSWATASVGHAAALAWRGGRTGRRRGVLRERARSGRPDISAIAPTSGRTCRRTGARACRPPWCRSNKTSRVRARMLRARRGVAAPRSTRWN